MGGGRGGRFKRLLVQVMKIKQTGRRKWEIRKLHMVRDLSPKSWLCFRDLVAYKLVAYKKVYSSTTHGDTGRGVKLKQL